MTIGYFVLAGRFRWAWLLAASCVFYAAFIPRYLFILAGMIVVDFVAGLAIERAVGSWRRWCLGVSLVANIGTLVVFKYFNFFSANVASIASALHWNYPVAALSLALPIGLSFHTFQAMSYTVEVYRGRQPAERHFGLFALYVMFYPQVVAGPIERPAHLLPQFREHHDFDVPRVVRGVQLMAWGLFKKVVIADRLAVIVDRVYGSPASFAGPELLLATILFSYQIFCDFSGYSDIAIGAAEVMGFRLATNFRRPSRATSISDFWNRWHVSLSTWFRDYVFLPLSGKHASRARLMANVGVVFLLSGLWHGANWTYVVWGGIHGALRITEELSHRTRRRIAQWVTDRSFDAVYVVVSRIAVFLAVAFAWIFFRASTMTEALTVVRRLTGGYRRLVSEGIGPTVAHLGVTWGHLLLIAILLAMLESIHHYQERYGSVRTRINSWPASARWSFYYAAIASVMLLGVFSDSKFIYFQF